MDDSIHWPGKHVSTPIFPLPNVVLFPRAVLPLHIFEDRYKAMVSDSLRGNSLIAMALLKPGWEQNYYARPEIHPVICIGTLLTHEMLPDGKYNLLLQGHTRAQIIREHPSEPYRVVEAAILEEKAAEAEDLLNHRERLISLFDGGSLLATGMGRQFRQLLASSIPTADIADLIAFNFLHDVEMKQTLLSDCDVHGRVSRIVEAFEASQPALPAIPFAPQKPSLN